MFADCLLDSGNTLSRRSWTTAASFALQAIALGVLLLLPLIYTEGLPQLRLVDALVAPAPPPSAPPHVPAARSAVESQSNLMGTHVMEPGQIPRDVQIINETVPPPPQIDPNAIGIAHGIGDARGTGNVITSIIGSTWAGPPPPTAPPPRVLRPSQFMEGNLIRRVQPEYPPLARQARIQGVVVLQAVISKDGTIENLVVLNGHPMLVRAALDAVQRWRYRPYYLNGQPVEVETQITINFTLTGG